MPRWCAALVCFLVLVLSAAGIATALRDPILKVVEIPLARLPPGLDGFRIGVLTDTHLGAAIGGSRLSRAVDILLSPEARPHAVAITGDLMDSDEAVFFPALEPLRRIGALCGNGSASSAPPASSAASSPAAGSVCAGAWFVSGNHDQDQGSLAAKMDMLRSMHIRPLINERVAVGWGLQRPQSAMDPPDSAAEETFDLVGVPDFAMSASYGTPHDMRAAVAGRDARRELVVLAHQPRHSADAGAVKAGLMISGHTHGGQMVPIVLVSSFAGPYVRGLYRQATDNMWVYVSAGTFQWGPIMRHIARHEVTILVLRAVP
jgi:hypothetical protein